MGIKQVLLDVMRAEEPSQLVSVYQVPALVEISIK